MNTAILKNDNQIWYVLRFAAPALVLAIGIQGLQTSFDIPEVPVSQSEIQIQQAKNEMGRQYQNLLKTLNATNLSPEQIENPGLEQATIMNLGLQLQQAMQAQIQNPEHPNYRQTTEAVIVRAILTNATEMLLASEIENPTTKINGDVGIVVSFYSQQKQKQVALRMPPEMLKIIAQSYAEALVTQLQIQNQVAQGTAVQTQKFINDLQNFADIQLTKSAYEGNDQMVEQLQNLNSQLNQEKEYYVDVNGGVYTEN